MTRNSIKRKVDLDEVLHLLSEGLLQTAIAKRLGCSHQRISQICKEHGVNLVKGSPANRALRAFILAHQHCTVAWVGKACGVPAHMVRYHAMAVGVKLARTKRASHAADKIRALAAQGYSVSEAAKILGVSPTSVSVCKMRHGIVFLKDSRVKSIPAAGGKPLADSHSRGHAVLSTRAC